MSYTEIDADTIRQRIREEALRLRASQMGRKLDQATLQQERIEELAVRLEESEADRAARLDQITELTRLLGESEADRAARLEVIHRLEEIIRGLQAKEGEPFAVRLARYISRIKTRRT